MILEKRKEERENALCVMVEAAGVEPASEKADNREPSCFSQF